MPKKYPKSDAIENSTTEPQEAYVFRGDDAESKAKALEQSAGALEEYDLVQKSPAAHRYSLDSSNLDTNTSGRPGLTRSDYDFFRPEESVPIKIKNILQKAEEIYQRVGLVKNVVDLMGDFGAQGIRIVHKNKRIQRFYERWFEKCGGKDRSERFLNNLYKSGNVVVHKQTARINTTVENKMFRGIAAEDIIVNDLSPEVEAKVIPWRYTFIDPVFVDVASGPLASFVANKRYELILPPSIRKLVNAPKTDAEKQIVADLPPAIIEAAKEKQKYPLDPKKTLVFHYKKDDWQAWAYPMIYSIMDDITVIEKLKLADMAALDGAISNIRIFKLGSLEHKIAPTKAATSKLAQILGNNVGGGTMDLVWGPDIEMMESSTNVHQFLGEAKYTPHLNSVYAGLGIPPTLTGTYGAAGTTNNFISLKTLTQRLQYGRDVLQRFWAKEIEEVQKAMGFREPARIEFDRMDLSNEEAEKSLLIQLADRNLVSDEMLRKRFGFDTDMEKSRLARESKERKSKKVSPKAGPYHDANFDNQVKKLVIQNGTATPSEVGVELSTKKDGEKTAIELKEAVSPKSDKLPGRSGEGRPKNSNDTEERKEKKFSPQTGAALTIWANQAQETIASIVNPIFLDFNQKKNLRSLSNEQAQELENIKAKILFNTTPNSTITQELVHNIINNCNDRKTLSVMVNYNKWKNNIQNNLSRTLSLEEQKYAKSSFYSMVYNLK